MKQITLTDNEHRFLLDYLNAYAFLLEAVYEDKNSAKTVLRLHDKIDNESEELN